MKRTWRNCDEYTALISATYSVAVNAETMWEAEDLAFDMVEEPLKTNDIEPDTFIVEERAGMVDGDYFLKLKVNMVVPVMATDERDAWDCAVELVESITMDEDVQLLFTEQVDMTLAENKAFLRKAM